MRGVSTIGASSGSRYVYASISRIHTHVRCSIHRDRQTDRQTDRHTNTQTDRQTDFYLTLGKQLSTSGVLHHNYMGREAHVKAFEAASDLGHPRNRKEENGAIMYR